MPNLSDHDLDRMDPAWVDSQPESVVRGLLERSLDDLRLVRGLVGQTQVSGANAPGSMPTWQGSGGPGEAVDDALVPAAVDGHSEPAAEPCARSSGAGRPG